MMSNVETYQPLTAEKVKGLFEQIQPQNRQLFAQTGEAGIKQFHKIMEKMYAEGMLEQLKDKLAVHELVSLITMVDSDDSRDLRLAETILETKLKEYESNI